MAPSPQNDAEGIAHYRAPFWLPGGHAQTIYASRWVKKPAVRYWRERWETPDFDFIDLDWIDLEDESAHLNAPNLTPLVVLFHGLEGHSGSAYACALMQAVQTAGWHGVVVHFRGCSGEPNRLPRAYHSGDSAEIDWILKRLRLSRQGPIHAVGVSLGGNALLKWLGEQAEKAHPILNSAAAICAPVDLAAASDCLGRGFNRFYTKNFLASLKAKTLQKMKRYPALCDRRSLLACKTLRAFDDLVTAPLHGFKGVDDYYTRSASKPWLQSIRLPTLMINPLNDPFLPARFLPTADALSDSILLICPPSGGHVGFVSAPFPGSITWLAQRILQFF